MDTHVIALPKNIKYTVGILSVFVVAMNMIFYPANILSWDVFGYYLYLPLTFLYHDLGLHQHYHTILHIIDTYHNTATFYQAVATPEGGWVMKYSMGMAILYAPFFLIGWGSAMAFGFPVDGFSAPFQNAIFAGGIFYTLIGLHFAAKVLYHFFSEKLTSLLLVLIVCGTNYIVHITMYGQSAMSQNYLFTGYAIILWLTILWHKTHQQKHLLAIAIVGGLMTLSRPTEIVVFLIPLLWGVQSKSTLWHKIELLKTHKKQVLLSVAVVIAIGLVQLVYWKIFAGKFLYNSYGGNAGEGLDLLSPYTWNFLFSFRKGWLIYTPIMVFAIAGFTFLYRKNKSVFWALFVYFIANLWLVSSWSNWWYAQSFSQRAMVSSYPVMAISLGYFLQWAFSQQQVWRVSITLLFGVVVSLNLFQTIQFHKGVLHPDRMTKAYYFATFGKLTVTDSERELLLINRSFDGNETFKNPENYTQSVLDVLDFDTGYSPTPIAHSGCCAAMLNKNTPYSASIGAPFEKITTSYYAWIRVSVWVFPTQKDIDENSFSLVAHFTHNGYAYKYRTREPKDLSLTANTWNKIEMDYLTPEVRKSTDEFRALVWYRGNNRLFLDNLKVEIFSPIKVGCIN